MAGNTRSKTTPPDLEQLHNSGTKTPKMLIGALIRPVNVALRGLTSFRKVYTRQVAGMNFSK